MKRLLEVVCLAWVLSVFALPAGAQGLSEEEQAAGFRALFNGRDLSGWRLSESSALPEKPSDVWWAEDGLIKLSGKGGPNLASQWDYDDFEMRFEWRALRDKYNSGFFIRSGRKVGANQINLAHGGEGKFIGGKITGGPAVPELQKPAGEWNEWRARVVGDKVSFYCNGQLAWEGTNFETKRGYVGLQTEGAPLEFRNLRILEIGYRPLEESAWKANEDRLQKKTLDSYADFALRLEWRAQPGHSSSLAFYADSATSPAVRMGDLEEGSGGLSVENARPKKKTDVPLGQWNYLEVRRAGSALSVWQNGETVVENLELKPPADAKPHPLAILLGEKPVEIQNVRVRTR